MSHTVAYLGCLLITALSVTLVPAASASIIGLPAFEITLASSGSTSETISGSNLGLSTMPDGTFTSIGTHTSLSGDADYTWDLLIDPDPTIGGTFSFTNLLSTAKDYNLSFSLPVGTAFLPAMVNGHFAGAVADSDGSGNAFLNDIIWSGLIDGAFVMGSGPASLGCAAIGCTTTNPTTYLGPTHYSPGVSGNIATNISFTLSAGDKVSFNTFFDVSSIPEPGTLTLLAGLPILAPIWTRLKKGRLFRLKHRRNDFGAPYSGK